MAGSFKRECDAMCSELRNKHAFSYDYVPIGEL